MSRMDLTPAETTATGVLPSSVRSALTSRAAGNKRDVRRLSPPTCDHSQLRRPPGLLTPLSVPVNSSDAPGDEHGDASPMGRYHGGGHRRTPGQPLLRGGGERGV